MDDFESVIEQLKQELGEDKITTTSDPKIRRPEKALERDMYKDFMDRNPLAGGGMLVQPSADGSRPGYAKTAREKNIARTAREKLPGAYITPLRRKFDGQKFISVKDPTYSEGRKRVKTPEYEAFLKKERAKKKPPTFGKTTFREVEDGVLLQIAEAMQKADIEDDAEYLMRNKKATKLMEKQQAAARKKTGEKIYKQRVYNKGMLDQNAVKYMETLETDPVRLKIIADTLGEDIDWVLDKIDEREQFVQDVKAERVTAKKDPSYTKPRNDYLKVENWVQKNAKKYANPDTFERALIRRFGKDNQFLKDMKSKKPFVTTYFSDGFKKTMLNAEAKTTIRPIHLKQFIKSSLYNFNPKIKNAVTTEIKNIFNSENLPKLRTEARKLLNNNKLLSTFGLNKAITGPYAKVIQAEIGQQLWSDITNFRKPRVGTQEMLKAFEQIVADEFKPMFKETARAIGFSKQNQWPEAKRVFGIADNIAWDHKVPSSLIDKGYADIIEYTKVNPTTSNFNDRIKNAQFDRPINQLIKKFEKATTLDAKAKIKNEMDIVKNNFSQKYGGYLDEVSINLDSQGNLKFSSSAKPLTTRDDRIAMLGKSLVQEGKIAGSEIDNLLLKFAGTITDECAVDLTPKKEGGRIGFKLGSEQCLKIAKKGLDNSLLKGFKNKQQIDLAEAILRAGGGLKSAFALRNILGPAAIAATVAFEGGLIGYDMLTSGKTLREAFGDNLLNYALGKDYQIDPQEELFKRFKGLGYNDQQLGKIKTSLDAMNTINTGTELAESFGTQLEALQKSRGQPQPFMGPEDQFIADTSAQRAEQNLKDTGNKLSAFNRDLVRSGELDRLNQLFQSGDYGLGLDLYDEAQRAATVQRMQSGGPKFVGSVSPKFEERRIRTISENLPFGGANPAFDFPGTKEVTGGTLYGFAGGGIAGLSGGIDEGPQRISMNPDSRGLSGLLKRGIKG